MSGILDRVGDFLGFCLQHGLGGLALLVIAGALSLLTVATVLIWALVGIKWMGAAFMTGFRRGWGT